MMPALRPHKYAAKRTAYGDRIYASKAEAAFARRLDLMKAAGAIRDWGIPDPIVLVPGKRGQAISYTADFWVEEADGSRVLYDVKGAVPQVFKLKLRLLRHFYPDVVLKVVDAQGREVRV